MTQTIESNVAGTVPLRDGRPDPAASPEALAFYGQFVRLGDLCFDIGANMGHRTECFRRLGARVVCVEPQPACEQVLRCRYSAEPCVTVVAAGVAAAPGTLPLMFCHDADTIATFCDHWKTGRFRDYAWPSAIEVPVTTLDALIARHGAPAFCKIDVEGFESQVLAGLSRPIAALSFEFTREFIADAQACMARLGALGRVGFNCTLGETHAFFLPHWTDPPALLARLAGLDDPLLWGDIYARFSGGPL